MKFGLSDQAIDAIHQVLQKYPQVKRAILFGSRAKGNYKPGSDIDLALDGDNQLDMNLLFQIEMDLDDLYLPYKMDMHLIDRINEQSMLDHIHRVGKLFYASEVTYS